MFFLKDDFFLDPDIADQMDFDAIGEDVKYAIANSGTTEELTAAGYDAEELAPYEDKTGEISEKLGRGRHTTRHVELCALPDYIRPVGILAAGKTEKVKEPHDRYLEERVHQDCYAEREEA